MTIANAVKNPAWTARLATSAVFFANGFGIGVWAASIPRLKAAQNLSDAGLSLALLALAAGSVLFMPVAGLLVPKFGGTGAVLRYSSIAFALVLALPGFADGLPAFAGTAFLVGAASGMMDVPMNAHATIVERDWGSAIMSSFHAAWSFGGLTGAGVGGVLIHADLPTHWLLAVAGAVTLAVAFAAVPKLGVGDRSDKTGPAFALPDRRVVGLCLIALLCFFLEGAMADWSAVYLTGITGASEAVAASGYAAFALMMVAGRLLGDRIVQKFGRGPVMTCGGSIAAIGFALAVAVPAPPFAIAGFALAGAGLSNVVPTVFSASANLSASPAAGIAMAATCGYAGFLGGPPLIGNVAALVGLRPAFCLLALAGLVVAGIAPRRRASTGA